MEWRKRERIDISHDLKNQFGDTRIVTQELARRGLIKSGQFIPFLDPTQYQQNDPFIFAQMEKAVHRITTTINNEEVIGIWGDFDVDGQTSTAILVAGLQRLGAQTCFHIPIRATESHGIDLTGFKKFLSESDPSLVITCDTGISDIDSIAYAGKQGVDVIITDHHKIPASLPQAYAIINPHQLPAGHPLSCLAGVGTAFQLLKALAKIIPDRLQVEEFYDLVALGTIADIAELRGENRFYAQMGLRQMNKQPHLFLQSLLSASSTKTKVIDEDTVGFIIAPRLNAAGRLGDANPNVNFLLSNDEILCSEAANTLEGLNAVRKLSVDNVLSSAREILRRSPEMLQHPAIVMMNSRWDGGVLGIAAGQLAKEHNRPVILMRESDGFASGSARSILGIDITEAIASQKHLLAGFGGHEMAGGLRMTVEGFHEFSAGLNKNVSEQSRGFAEPEILIDHFITFAAMNEGLLQELKLLSPFGAGNPAPIFASRSLKLLQVRKFGNQDQHLKLNAQDTNGDTQEFIWWNAPQLIDQEDSVDIAYHISRDTFTPANLAALELVAMRRSIAANEPTIDLLDSHVEVIDFLTISRPIERCAELLQQHPELQIWYEGLNDPIEGGLTRTRLEIVQSEHLAFLTAPPSIQVLEQVVKACDPSHVYFFNIEHKEISVETLLKEVGKTLKSILREPQSVVSINFLASCLNQTPHTIQLCMDWYEAHGDLEIDRVNQDKFTFLKSAHQPNPVELRQLQEKLNKSLKETAAFRAYYRRANTKLLLRQGKH